MVRSKTVRQLALAMLAPLLAVVPAQVARAAEPAVVFLLRHAEPLYPPPADAAGDPRLNVMGQERADALARLLDRESIDRIFSSDYHRTRETAQPLADRFGLAVEIYDPHALEPLSERLASLDGRTVVVGHSNTTPRLVELLGGSPGEPIDEGREFDRLYVLVRDADGGYRTVRLRYGAPLPGNWRELAQLRREER